MYGFKTVSIAALTLGLSACGGLGSAPPTGVTSVQGHVSSHAVLPRLQNLTGAAAPFVLDAIPGEPGRSWMLPEAKSETLLYVSDIDANRVDVYSYPKLKAVGQLSADMLSPDGLCTDAQGDVFVVMNTPNVNDVVEFAHGGTTPIQTLQDPGQIAISCSVDPVTGNLAVTNVENISYGAGSISIYPKATGYPTNYADSKMAAPYFCAYDDKGNLYVDGLAGGPSDGPFELAEIPKGKSTFTPVTLKDTTINFPGDLLWDGKYLDVADQEYAVNGSVLTGAIYRTTGAAGKVVSKDVLANSDDLLQYFTVGSDVIGANYYGGLVAFWQYPTGGKEIKTITGFNAPIGIALSK